ncbi:hypothetical protein G5714_014196 [Onychostoma macrolepis]|uniref:Uncharacterized protein n=1 Tax=Onychostoma macrolepis TaxID=369639 RepID=A0A7J6CE01_9TELE|nr:hypothetical protein G5714_014196 [Onychostoma macrolepis]
MRPLCIMDKEEENEGGNENSREKRHWRGTVVKSLSSGEVGPLLAFGLTIHGLNLTVGHMRQPLLSPSLRLFLSPKSSVSMKRPEDAISSSLSRCQAAILRGPSLLNSA